MNEVRPVDHHPVTLDVWDLFQMRGSSEYGGEAVTQLQHALQTADLARQANASPALIVAALLHDVGHLLHTLTDDAPDQGIDDVHEVRGAIWAAERFSRDVVRPLALHVAAKRYLCATDAMYFQRLSPPSVQSLALQGGPMTTAELRDFEADAYHRDAIQLRHWDEAAKDPLRPTPALETFLPWLDAMASLTRSA